MSTERDMSRTLRKMGLEEWQAHWKPGCSSSKRGEALPESKLIIVYDVDEEKAQETLIHEALEIKLRGLTSPYRTLVNALLEWADKIAYEQKERTIDSLIPLMRPGEAEPKNDSAPEGE